MSEIDHQYTFEKLEIQRYRDPERRIELREGNRERLEKVSREIRERP